MNKLIYISEGLRMFRRRIRVLLGGIRRYEGDANDICRAIINDCWNKKHHYFMTSAGHFCEFWTRDFAWCIGPLIRLGHKRQVMQTLEYAIRIFKAKGAITTTIDPKQRAFDFPAYALDAVPLFICSLEAADAYDLIEKHHEFLQNKINEFHEVVIDKSSGLVRKDRHFSSMKDHAIQQSSCYGNCMASLLKDKIEQINKKKPLFSNPLEEYDYEELIKRHFWTGSYFLDDLSGNKEPTGDANTIPFIYGPFRDRKMLESCIRTIRKHSLDAPFPLKYSQTGTKKHKMIPLEVLAEGYEHDSIWMHMGPLYIRLVSTVDKNLAQDYLKRYRDIIEKYGNYLEVFGNNGTPYQSLLYHSDESMLWAANSLDMESCHPK